MKQVERMDIDSAIDYKLLVQLTNDDPVVTTPNEDRILEFIDLANCTIEDSLRSQYPLPFKNKHKVLTDIGIEICLYNVYLIRYRNKLPEDIKYNYEKAMKLLNDYARSIKTLGNELSDEGSLTRNVKVKSRTQSFTSEILAKY